MDTDWLRLSLVVRLVGSLGPIAWVLKIDVPRWFS
jgi:hypothetical protein